MLKESDSSHKLAGTGAEIGVLHSGRMLLLQTRNTSNREQVERQRLEEVNRRAGNLLRKLV